MSSPSPSPPARSSDLPLSPPTKVQPAQPPQAGSQEGSQAGSQAGLPDLSAFRYEPQERPTAAVAPAAATKKRPAPDAGSPSAALLKRPKNWPGPLPPLLEPGLNIVFVGFNPGVESGRSGHHYAHHSNRFWKFLFWSKVTPTLHSSADDVRFPELYRIGFTDLVARCTKGIGQLSKEEMAQGVASLDQRIAECRPRAVCLVGKGIWETVAGVRKWDKKQFRYGRDPNHTLGDGSSLYCVASTSGLNSIAVEKQLEGWREMVREVLETSSIATGDTVEGGVQKESAERGLLDTEHGTSEHPLTKLDDTKTKNS